MPRPNPRHIVLALLLAASITFLLVSLRGTGARPAAEGDRQEAKAADASQPRAERPLEPAISDDADFGRYAKLAQADLFSERRAEPPPPPKPPKPASLPPLPGSAQAKPPEPKVDFAGWSYMGYIELDDRKLGLLQNDTTHTCEYLAVGDSFMGAKVETLDREDIRLRVGSSRTTLNRPRDFPVTPLAKAAAPAPAPRQQR
ncbi:MAG: hypothetical protein MUQ65_02540 [Armatimonadetes bacterium]|nr:hypothetical protein [Armatimonadota bacterium]